MYKNFNITESEKEQILNRLKENGYGQPINEQNAPDKKPVAPQPQQQKQSVDNVSSTGKFSGKVDPKLVQQLNMVKELTNIIISNEGVDGIKIITPKTIKDAGVILLRGPNYFRDQVGFSPGNGSINNCVLKFDTYKINGAFTKRIFGVIELKQQWGGTVKNHPTIVETLCSSKNIEEFQQNLNKYPVEVYARQEFLYDQKELYINVFFQNLESENTASLFERFTYGRDGSNDLKLSFIKQIETIYPNFKQNVIGGYDNLEYETYKNRDTYKNGEQDKNYIDSMKLWGKQKEEFLKLYNQQPTAPVPQGQPTAPQTQKPLNEGQEILKDVFKSLIK